MEIEVTFPAGKRVDARVGAFTIATDQPVESGGEGSAPAPFESMGLKSMYLDHISYQCTSYKETVAFYEALLGWKGLGDEGSQNETEISPEIGGLLIRGGNATAPEFKMPEQRRAVMNHISFGVSPFDADKIWAEACKRGIRLRVDTGAIEEVTTYRTTNHPLAYQGGGEQLSWATDGSALAYLSADEGPEGAPGDPMVITRYGYKSWASMSDNRRWHIYVVTLADKKVRALTSGPQQDHSIAWSPKGDEIAYISNHEPDPDLGARSRELRRAELGRTEQHQERAPAGDARERIGLLRRTRARREAHDGHCELFGASFESAEGSPAR